MTTAGCKRGTGDRSVKTVAVGDVAVCDPTARGGFVKITDQKIIHAARTSPLYNWQRLMSAVGCNKATSDCDQVMPVSAAIIPTNRSSNWFRGVALSSGLWGVVIALIAVVVAIWQVRASAIAAERSNSLPVTSDAFKEFRSREFQDHLRKVWNETPSSVPEGGFQSLPADWRDSAYEVAYFFEYLGVLVAYRLVPEDLIVDFSANLLARSWRALEPFIREERMHRQKAGISGTSSGFVTHFEHLVALTIDAKGKPIDGAIHERLKLRSVPHSQ